MKDRETLYRRHKVPVNSCSEVKYVLKRASFALEAKTAPKKWNYSMHISLARLASFCHLGVISDPLIVSKFHNETHDPKGQENKIHTKTRNKLLSNNEKQQSLAVTNLILKSYRANFSRHQKRRIVAKNWRWHDGSLLNNRGNSTWQQQQVA